MAEKLMLRYTADAVDDLDVIFSFINEDNRSAALNMVDRIEEAILRLEGNPRLGAVLTGNYLPQGNRGYRYIVVKPYVVFYRIGKNELYILRILHSRQDWMNLLFKADFLE